MGIMYCAPALLTRISRLASLLTQAAMDDSDVTSSVSVSIPKEARCDIFDWSRAVA